VQSACAVFEEYQRVHPAQVDQVDVSQAMTPSACAVRNWRQVGPLRRGAGSMPAAVRISQTVVVPMGCPRRTSSPWIRRQPQRGSLEPAAAPVPSPRSRVGGLPGLRRRLL
jgi:hypothetical protein